MPFRKTKCLATLRIWPPLSEPAQDGKEFQTQVFFFRGRYLHSLDNSEKHLSVIHIHTHNLVANDIYFS